MIHVCLATDDNYVHYTMMCIYDIVIRQNEDTEITFYVLTDRLSDESMSQLHELDHLPRTTLVFIPVDSSMIAPDKDLSETHLSTASMLRVLIPELKELEGIERVLWLDSDTLCRRDITSLYNWDLNDKAIGATKGSVLLAYADPSTVPWKVSDFNSGVMLMDLAKLRSLQYTTRMTQQLCREQTATYEKVLYDLYHNEVAYLPPICNVPYHNFVRNNFNTKMFCRLDRWNEYHGTHYESFHEIFDQAYFFHFHEEKELYLRSPQIKAIYRTSEKRLAEYLETKQVMSWTPEDDRVFLDPCEDIIFFAVDLVQQDIAAFAEAERLRRGVTAPEVTEWSFFFDVIYCMHSHDTSKRSIPVYHEMNRVGMAKTGLVQHHYTTRSVFDEYVYKGGDHTFFDLFVSEKDRYKKINQMLAYHDLFCRILDTGANRILICEDDVVFLRELMSIRHMFDHLPATWDYIKFERINGTTELKDKFYGSISEGEYYHSHYTGGYRGSACCAYSRKAVELAIKIMEEQLTPIDCVLENREDDRLNELGRFVSSKNLVIEAGRDIYPEYEGIADLLDYWSTAEYHNLAKGEL